MTGVGLGGRRRRSSGKEGLEEKRRREDEKKRREEKTRRGEGEKSGRREERGREDEKTRRRETRETRFGREQWPIPFPGMVARAMRLSVQRQAKGGERGQPGHTMPATGPEAARLVRRLAGSDGLEQLQRTGSDGLQQAPQAQRPNGPNGHVGRCRPPSPFVVQPAACGGAPRLTSMTSRSRGAAAWAPDTSSQARACARTEEAGSALTCYEAVYGRWSPRGWPSWTAMAGPRLRRRLGATALTGHHGAA